MYVQYCQHIQGSIEQGSNAFIESNPQRPFISDSSRGYSSLINVVDCGTRGRCGETIWGKIILPDGKFSEALIVRV